MTGERIVVDTTIQNEAVHHEYLAKALHLSRTGFGKHFLDEDVFGSTSGLVEQPHQSCGIVDAVGVLTSASSLGLDDHGVAQVTRQDRSSP